VSVLTWGALTVYGCGLHSRLIFPNWGCQMPISLHECTVASFDTTLGALEQVLAKGRAYCEESDIALDDVVGTRLRDDMLPFHFQVVSAWHHSVGALNGVKAGEFAPPPKIERDYAGLQALLGEAREGLYRGYR
jgi:hypothetical protein